STIRSSASTPFLSSFNAPATPEPYTLSLHDALPILGSPHPRVQLHQVRPPVGRPGGPEGLPQVRRPGRAGSRRARHVVLVLAVRSEEHTSELQSRGHLVCRLLLEKKKNDLMINPHSA